MHIFEGGVFGGSKPCPGLTIIRGFKDTRSCDGIDIWKSFTCSDIDSLEVVRILGYATDGQVINLEG